MNETENNMNQIAAAIQRVRVPAEPEEYDIHAAVAEALHQLNIPFTHECVLAPRCRIDFLAGRIGIEIKKGKPMSSPLKKQLERYLASDRLDGLVVVMQQGITLPNTMVGKPVKVLSLNRNWGVALP